MFKTELGSVSVCVRKTIEARFLERDFTLSDIRKAIKEIGIDLTMRQSSNGISCLVSQGRLQRVRPRTYRWVPKEGQKVDGLGQRMRIVRGYVGMTQVEFAGTFNVSPNHITRIEAGRRGMSAALIDEVVANCGLNRSWLLDGIGEMLCSSGADQTPILSTGDPDQNTLESFEPQSCEMPDSSTETGELLSCCQDILNSATGYIQEIYDGPTTLNEMQYISQILQEIEVSRSVVYSIYKAIPKLQRGFHALQEKNMKLEAERDAYQKQFEDAHHRLRFFATDAAREHLKKLRKLNDDEGSHIPH